MIETVEVVGEKETAEQLFNEEVSAETDTIPVDTRSNAESIKEKVTDVEAKNLSQNSETSVVGEEESGLLISDREENNWSSPTKRGRSASKEPLEITNIGSPSRFSILDTEGGEQEETSKEEEGEREEGEILDKKATGNKIDR